MKLEDKILQVIGGLHEAAVATVTEDCRPAVRFMSPTGYHDLTLVGATMKKSRKVSQMQKNPNVAISIWSGRDYSDPYVVITAVAEIHDDIETKTEYWDALKEQHFQTPENPDYVIVKFIPRRIEYYHGVSVEVWER